VNLAGESESTTATGVYTFAVAIAGQSLTASSADHNSATVTVTQANIDNGLIIKLTQRSTQSCFIATATYGSAQAPEMQFLRELRENKLRRTRWGLEFFDRMWAQYYRFSPAIAQEMVRDPECRQVIGWSIVRPWMHYMKLLVSRPDWDKIEFDALEPGLREFLQALRADMDSWLSEIDLPREFSKRTAMDVVRELNVAIGFVLKSRGVEYLDDLLARGVLPVFYAPEAEESLLAELRGEGRTQQEVDRILYGRQS
jgi:hypothetical protein